MKALFFSRKTLALLLLVAVGIAKLPLEQKVSDDLREQHLVEAPLGVDMMESLGQMGLAAAAGGLRSLVASITYLIAYSAFEDVNWADVAFYMMITTRLDPHNAMYWEDASWHMAFNAASFYERDTTLRPAIRAKVVHDHIVQGVDILKEGLRYLPGNVRLLIRLGLTYKDKLGDHRKAAEAFMEAYQNGGQDYNERISAYEMVGLNDRASWERAYKILKRYYDMGMRQKNTTIMKDLPILEERLGIPQDQRVKPMPTDSLPPHYQPNKPRPKAATPGK